MDKINKEELESIRKKLLIAQEFGLVAEVVYQALIEMKHNVAITPLIAVNAGCHEFEV
jgi:hypothetical protein